MTVRPKIKCFFTINVLQRTNKSFVYININPYRIEDNDCVVRAISLGLGLHYKIIQNLIKQSAEINGCEELCVDCYHHLLDGFFGLPVRFCNEGETVSEIAEKNRNSRCIIRIQGHLTCSLYGKLYDIWDCSHKKVYCYWIV